MREHKKIKAKRNTVIKFNVCVSNTDLLIKAVRKVHDMLFGQLPPSSFLSYR